MPLLVSVTVIVILLVLKKVPAALSLNIYLNITAGCKSLLLEWGWDGVCCVRIGK